MGFAVFPTAATLKQDFHQKTTPKIFENCGAIYQKTQTNNVNPNCLSSPQGKWQLQKLLEKQTKLKKTSPKTTHFCQNN
jgi:hypothetical protein